MCTGREGHRAGGVLTEAGPASLCVSQELRPPRMVLPSLPPCVVTPPVPPVTARVGLMHIGVFILLLLSGERNFGVRLNKPYSVRVPMDIPVFTGTHADLLIVVRGPLGAWGRCPRG